MLGDVMKFEKVKLTKENIKEIKKIDDIFYQDDDLDLNWYLDRYTEKHMGYLIKDNNKVVGYLVSVPIKKVFYKALISGVLINDTNVNPDMFVTHSKYNYIISFVLLPDYRHKGIGSELIKSVIKSVNHGYYCSLAISKEGNALSRKFMKLKKHINDNISVYEIKI